MEGPSLLVCSKLEGLVSDEPEQVIVSAVIVYAVVDDAIPIGSLAGRARRWPQEAVDPWMTVGCLRKRVPSR